MYPVVRRTILFRDEHSRRTLVSRVEFVSARGDPAALLTGKALFSWQKDRHRFRLESTHEKGDVRDQTGFDYDAPGDAPLTPPPSREDLSLLRGPVAQEMAADYPDFAARVWGINVST
jgi:glutaconate CoA-transferase subunit B